MEMNVALEPMPGSGDPTAQLQLVLVLFFSGLARGAISSLLV